MATLLDLVNQLIGDVLKGNIYTNTTQFNSLVYKIPVPDGVPTIETPAQISLNSDSGNRIGPAPLDTAAQFTNVTTDTAPPPVTSDSKKPFSTDSATTYLDSQPTLEATRQNIYKTSVHEPTPSDGVPSSISQQVATVRADQSFVVGKSFDPSNRLDLYAFHANAVGANDKNLRANIGSTYSHLTEGDVLGNSGKPPPGPLSDPAFAANGAATNTFAPVNGRIDNKSATNHQGNIYNDTGFDFVKDTGHFSLIPGLVSPLRFFDIGAIAHWLRDIGREVYFLPQPFGDPVTGRAVGLTDETIAKSTTWLASQFLLASMNPGDPQAYGLTNMLWNPLSLLAASIPGADAVGDKFGLNPSAPTIGPAFLGNYRSNTQDSAAEPAESNAERLLLMREGAYSETAWVERLSKLRKPQGTPGYIGDIAAPGTKAVNLEDEKIPLIDGVTVAQQVDGGEGSTAASLLGYHTNLYTADNPYSADNAILPLEKAEGKFVPRTSTVPNSVELAKLSALFSNIESNQPFGSKKSLFYNSWTAKPKLSIVPSPDVGISTLVDAPGLDPSSLDADFAGAEDTLTNLVGSTNGKPIDEDQIYMPFMFQDLRKINSTSKDQFLYFRAFLKPGLSELFTPEWQLERYYGRVDQVPTYVGTSRNINVSFDVVAFSPRDLNIIWNKLKKLQSLVYPFYNQKGFMSAGPIIRMRIGDLIAGNNSRGLPGYITSMDWQYDDGIWNIAVGSRVPRKISISLGFTVLHEGNPGVYPYNAATIDPTGLVTLNTTDQDGSGNAVGTFGAGQFTVDNGGNVSVTVSQNDIRNIFGSVGIKQTGGTGGGGG